MEGKIAMIHKSLSSDEIIKEGTKGFAMLIKASQETGMEMHEQMLSSFVAGFTCSLMVCGFNQEDAFGLSRKLLEKILSIGGMTIDGKCMKPDCKNCKK